MALGVLAWMYVATATLLFALAAGLLALNFVSRLNRAFALLLFLRGMTALSGILRDAYEGQPLGGVWHAMWIHFDLASVFAVAAFGIAYVAPTRGGDLARLGIAGAAAATTVAYALDHCLVDCPAPDGRLALGPLAVLQFAAPLTYGLLALLLVADARRRASPARNASASLVAFGLALNAWLDAAITTTAWASAGVGESIGVFAPNAWAAPSFAVRALAAVPAAAALLLLARAASPRARRAGAVAVAAAAATGALLILVPDGLRTPLLVMVGLWRLSMPALVSYALLRHGLFDLDLRLRRGIGRGTVAGAFLAVFLVASEVAKEYLGGRYGLLAGGLAAALLVFAAGPLERIGHRVAQAAVPTARAPEDLGIPDKRALYRDQAELAWSDGVLDRTERAMLDRLRDRLGLAREDAALLEEEAARAVA